MLPVVRTPAAEKDLEEILSYLEERSPPAAEKLAQLIDEKCLLLESVPLIGRPRDELAPGLRSVVVGRHILFYRVTESAVQVIRILHASRDVERILKEDGNS